MSTDTIRQLGAEFHHAADGVGEALQRLERARTARLAFLRQCSKDSTARLATLKEELRTLPEQIAKWDAEAARLESQTAEDLLRQALDARKCDGDHKGPLCADKQCWLRCPDCGKGEHYPAACGAVVLHPQPPGEVIEAPLTQPKPDPYRAGLPPERLRKVWAEWEDDEGDILMFTQDGQKFGSAQFLLADVPWAPVTELESNERYRPHGATWARVEAMADEADKSAEPKMLDLTKLPPGTVCEAVGEIAVPCVFLKLKVGRRFSVVEVMQPPTAEGEDVRVLIGDDTWALPALVPARVVKEGGER